jgi:hypothetical protein
MNYTLENLSYKSIYDRLADAAGNTYTVFTRPFDAKGA